MLSKVSTASCLNIDLVMFGFKKDFDYNFFDQELHNLVRRIKERTNYFSVFPCKIKCGSTMVLPGSLSGVKTMAMWL